ncbi:hypothetical protein AMS68_002928 [Peltaster fructicola]|uniref:Flavoprotein domain-containing protein n=1 Tax=Peltaster fructicola TaxID=286661 RepID=A0A6H0XRX8_9PEZI|nr:hypothetical protein AMS68_002928 [Peltaster fructicola]
MSLAQDSFYNFACFWMFILAQDSFYNFACFWMFILGSMLVKKLIDEDAKRKNIRSPTRQRLRAADHINDGKKHLLLCATGSVATIKIPNIVQALATHSDLSIRIIFTRSARQFLQSQADEQPSIEAIAKYKNVDSIYFDEDEWSRPWVRGDNILHIELRRWADLMVVVPLSANSLAKLALGLSNDLFSSVARAWDTSGLIDPPRPGIEKLGSLKRIIVAPAMNTAMWEHPVTAQHVAVLEGRWAAGNGGWFEMLRPKEGELACGDVGSGSMRDWKDIVAIIEDRLKLTQEAWV